LKHVLVTGGTGFIGIELVRRLCEMGLRPRVLVRRPHRAALLTALDVELVAGDLASNETLARTVEGIDTVFHLGGRASFESYRRLAPTLVDGTERLGRTAAAAGVRHFVFASSLFVYGDQSMPIGATTPADPQIGYGVAKLEAETRLGAIADTTDMTISCVRLPHVYGPQSILFDQVRRGIAVFPGEMANRCGQLHVEDSAAVLLAAGEQRWAGTSAVADDEVVTWREFFDVVSAYDPRVRLIALPKWLSYAGAAVLEPVFSRARRPTLYTKDTVTGFNLDVPVAPRLLASDLGVDLAYPSVRTGIPAVFDGYLRYRWRHPIMDRRWR
jgi:nucleoside-diphosphate-sugar epimerase